MEKKRKKKSNVNLKSPNEDTSFVRVDADPIEHRDTGTGIGWRPQGVGGKIHAPWRLTMDLSSLFGIKKWASDDD